MAQPEKEVFEQPDDQEVKKEILKDDELIEPEKEPEKLHLKTKTIPAIVMLVAGLVAAVDTFIQRYPMKKALIVIFCTLLIFLILGNIVKALLDRIEIIPPKEEEPESESDADGQEDEEEKES